jgi:ABC-type cobalamin transport system ATPase subunit
MNPIVKVERLSKTYGTTVAVDEVTFDVQEGEIFGMIGPNGAGKTTTIECLEGLRKPDSGTVSVLAGFVLSSLSFYSIGFILAGLMPTARTAQVVGMVLLYPMLFLSGAGFPRELLPENIKTISTFLPLTYVVNLLRGLWIGEAWSQFTTEVIVLAAILVVGVLVSIKTFRWE